MKGSLGLALPSTSICTQDYGGIDDVARIDRVWRPQIILCIAGRTIKGLRHMGLTRLILNVNTFVLTSIYAHEPAGL